MIRNEDIPEGGVDIPGPIDWGNTSHGLEYDYDNFTVQTWGKMGPLVDGEYAFRLMTRIRPMVGSEIIHAKLRGHTRDEILKAYGIDESAPIPVRYITDPKVVRMQKWTIGLTIFNVVTVLVHVLLFVFGVL